jgi:probable phosphoglycerate mutase
VAERFPEEYARWLDSPHEVTFPGGESLQDVHDRSIPPIEELLADDGTWVVVTHDTVARLAVAAAWGTPVTGFSSVALENAAITTLVGPTLRGSVHRLNEVDHLGELRVNLGSQAL